MKPYAGLAIALSFCALVAPACSSAPVASGCSPECPSTSTCDPVQGICIPNEDSGVPVSTDMAMAQCSPECSAPLAYCDQNHRCVACLIDSHCAAGNICKNAICVPGCTDDASCRGGNMSSPFACCSGQCLDITSDPRHCGGCAIDCAAANSSSSCSGGMCAAGTCNPGWGDCNMDAKDGCETPLHTDPANCGKCGMMCTRANGIAGCSDACYLRACNFGFDDCDGMEDNGCETPVLSDVKNCGACGTICTGTPHAKAGCINAGCQITACDQGYTDCDNQAANGCEAATGTDAKNCGTCGTVCGGNLVCINGGCTCPMCNIPNSKTKCVNNQCTFDSCVAGFGDCDNNQANGCEVDFQSDANNCSGCGVICPNNTPSCGGGVCTNLYSPSGVQLNVPVAQLAGWSLCYSDTYNIDLPVATVLQKCTRAKLLLACRPNNNATLSVMAWAPRVDVLTDTGQGNMPHIANNVEWYYNAKWSWGFAANGDMLSRNSCDTAQGGNRICWHTGQNVGGYRCGGNMGLNGDASWDRLVYEAD